MQNQISRQPPNTRPNTSTNPTPGQTPVTKPNTNMSVSHQFTLNHGTFLYMPHAAHQGTGSLWQLRSHSHVITGPFKNVIQRYYNSLPDDTYDPHAEWARIPVFDFIRELDSYEGIWVEKPLNDWDNHENREFIDFPPPNNPTHTNPNSSNNPTHSNAASS
ncbi:MAG: hypothetical protein K0U52_12300, partial [Gammaproteobacteria bacterium]|nr:hypothetical protein [Gammaproteobacteria bacterium]